MSQSPVKLQVFSDNEVNSFPVELYVSSLPKAIRLALWIIEGEGHAWCAITSQNIIIDHCHDSPRQYLGFHLGWKQMDPKSYRKSIRWCT